MKSIFKTRNNYTSFSHLRAFALSCFLLFAFFVFAQASHEFSVNGGGGMSTINYKLLSGDKQLGFGAEFGVGYTCIFTKTIGIRIGADIALLSGSANLYDATVVTRNLTDNEGDRFNLHSTLSQYKESQNATFLNIPVMAQFQTGENHKLYALAGAKIGIPISSKFKVSDATITNEAYYPDFDNWLKKQEFAGYGTFKNISSEGKPNFTISAALALEAGMKWKIGKSLAVYTGAYFDYGLNNIAPKNERYINYNASDPANFTTNSALVQSEKVNLIAAGLKVRLAFLPNGAQSASNEKTEKEKVEKVKVEKEKKVKEPKKKRNTEEQLFEEVSEIVPVEAIELPVEVELTTAAEFKTGRPAHAGFPASAMGIIWTSNVDANTAKFTTAPNALVILPDKAAFDAISSQKQLQESFDLSKKSNDFTAKGGSNFKPQYFIVRDGETLRLIEMTGITFKAGESKAYFTERH